MKNGQQSTILILFVSALFAVINIKQLKPEIQEPETELKSVYVTPAVYDTMTPLVPQESYVEPLVAAEEPIKESMGIMYITGYDPFCPHCVGKKIPDGITASGETVTILITFGRRPQSFGRSPTPLKWSIT